MGKTYFNYKFPKQTFQSKYSDNKQIVKNPLKVPELDHILKYRTTKVFWDSFKEVMAKNAKISTF